MTKNKLLLLLVLLMTAATGAWGMQIYISYPSWPTGTNVNGDGNLVLEMEASDSFENMKAKIEDKSGLNPDYMKLYFNSVEMANNETLNAKGVTSNSVLTLVYTPPYTVSMKDGVKDADKWTVKVGEGEAQALPIGGLKGDGSETVTLQYNGRLKVKGVKATSDAAAEATPALSITSPSVGQVIGSDGKNYAYGSLPTGVTAVAKICYVSGSNGLALALTDEEGKNDWSTAQTVCAAHTAPFTGGTWKLATKDEWDNMINAAGSYSALHDGFSSVGGTNMQEDYYWSSTEYDSDFAWYYDGYNEEDWDNGDKVYNLYVRACLVFTVEQAAPAANIVDLATLTADYEAQNGDVLTGKLGKKVKISIADGATVTLDNATIKVSNSYDDSYSWAGLNCLGNATIILKDGTTNTVRGFYENYPGIHVPAGSKLTIQGGTEGTGKLTASPFDGGTEDSYGAGIGGGFQIACGDISIEGGVITANGGCYAAGIGGGTDGSCGNITITGGDITATGGREAAGIGSGYKHTCGNITIASTVKKVTATKGEDAPYSIGKGTDGSCGTVTIGGTVYWQDNAAVNGGDTYLGQATIIYPEP